MRPTFKGRNPYEWWFTRPNWLKNTLAVLFIGLSAGLWVTGWIWPWGYATGFALILDALFLGD
jgi:hypothetical protein